MSPAVVKEKAKSEKRKKVVQEKENGKEVAAPPSKQVVDCRGLINNCSLPPSIKDLSIIVQYLIVQ